MDIQNYFNSSSFWDILNELNINNKDEWDNADSIGYYNNKIEEAASYLVEAAIRFYLLFQDEKDVLYHLNNYLTELIPAVSTLHQSSIYNTSDNLLLSYLIKSKGIEHNNLQQVEKEILFKTIYDKVVSKNYMFHAFNNSMFDSIKENGINPHSFLTKQEDIDNISNIYKKYGMSSPFFMQENNCVNKVSYSRGPNVSYGYGIDSPEWFANFCSRGKNDCWDNSYEVRDYDNVLQNVMNTISSFANEDKQIVLNFFKKNWNVYASSENIPILAIMTSDNSLLAHGDYDYEYSIFRRDMNYYFEYWYLKRMNVDNQTNYIDTKDALFIQLPSYNRLMDLSLKKYSEKTHHKK